MVNQDNGVWLYVKILVGLLTVPVWVPPACREGSEPIVFGQATGDVFWLRWCVLVAHSRSGRAGAPFLARNRGRFSGARPENSLTASGLHWATGSRGTGSRGTLKAAPPLMVRYPLGGTSAQYRLLLATDCHGRPRPAVVRP